MSGFKKLAFALVMVAVAFACCMCMVGDSDDAYAAEVVESGTAYNGANWTLMDDGELIISGDGTLSMYSSQPDGYTTVSDVTKVRSVTINDGVVILDSGCFMGFTALESVSIPSTVKIIMNNAFRNCTSLYSITIPESVTYLYPGGGIFEGCSSLRYADIKAEITELPHHSFNNCVSLESVALPETLKLIDANCFYGCISLRSIDLPDGLTSIEYMAFANSGLEHITIPGNVKHSGRSLFFGCDSLRSIVLESGVAGFDGASGCANLETVLAYDGIVDMGSYDDCTSLTSIVIPATVRYSPSFWGCYNLIDVAFYGSEPPEFGNNDFALGSRTINNPTNQSVNTTIRTNGGWGSYEIFNNDVIGGYTHITFESLSLPVKHNVTLTTNEYYDVIEILSITDNTVLIQPDDPVKEHYTFGGYYTDYNCSTSYDWSVPITDDVFVYVKWIPVEYVASFDTMGGTECPDVTYSADANPTFPSDPEKTGHTFNGWYLDPECKIKYNWMYAPKGDATYYAGWTINTYTVNFQTTGDSEIPSQTVEYGGLAVEPETPTRYGYRFLGWTYLGTDYDWSTPITESITLYGSWERIGLAINFDSMGGSSVDQESVYYGESVSQPSSPWRTGYSFDGWYTESECINAYVWSTPVTQDLTLYAKWTPIEYTLTFDTMGGSYIEPQIVLEGHRAKEVEVPTKVGHTFDGWYYDTSYTEGIRWYNVFYNDVTVYAKWTVNTYQVSFEDASGSNIPSQTIEYGSTVSEPDDPVWVGYGFGGWFTDSDCTQAYDFETPVTQDVMLFAKWTINTYKITFDRNGGTSTATMEIVHGHIATEPIDPTRLGYFFDQWYMDEDCTVAYDWSAPVKEDLTLYAGWIENRHTVSYDSNGGTAYEDSSALDGYAAPYPGEPTKEGYTFDGWFTDSGCTVLYDFKNPVPVTEDIVLYAGWTIVTNKVVFETYGGTNVPTQTVDYGSTPIRPDDPVRIGYEFGGWYAYSSFTYEYDWSAPITKVTWIYAKWIPIYHEIVFHSNGGSDVESIQVLDSHVADMPDSPTMEGHTFRGWFTDPDCTLAYDWDTIVTTDLMLYAKWEIQRIYIHFESNEGSAVESLVVDYGTIPEKPADPTKDGYNFMGWYEDETCMFLPYEWDSAIKQNLRLYAKWELKPIEHTIVFESNGGSDVGPIVIENGQVATKPTDPTKVKHTFAGWYTDGDLTERYVWSNEVTYSFTLYAKWIYIPDEFTIMFDTDGGSVIEDMIVLEGSKATKPTDPTKDGHTFAGWYTDEDCTVAYDWSAPVTENFTLYAGWTIKTVYLIFETYGGTQIPLASYEYGAIPEKPIDPTRLGYLFDKWYVDEDCTVAYDWSVPVTETINLYAGWTENRHTVTFDRMDGSETTEITVLDGYRIYEPEKPIRDGYAFAGWYTDSDEAYDWNHVVTESFTLYAKWTYIPKEYTVTFDSNGGSLVDSKVVVENEAVTEPNAPILYGYTFRGWYTDSDERYDFDTPVVGDMTLYAKWEKDTVFYTISLDLDGGTGIQSITVKEGESAIRPSNPIRAGFEFLGWYTDSDVEYDWELTVNEDFTLHAKWKEIVKHTVTFVINGDDETIIDPRQVEDGKVVIRPDAPTKDGYEFDGWYADSGCSVAYDFDTPVVGDMTLYAKWNKMIVKHTIAFNTNGASVIEPMEVIDGQIAVKPTDPTKDGYRFDGWYMDSEFVTEYDWSSVVTGSMVLHAKWTELDLPQVEFTVSFNTNGGSDVPSQRVLLNGCAVEPDAPTKDSSTFVGWFADFECEIPFVWSTPITQDTIVHAKWEYVPPVGPVMITVYVDGVATEVEEGSTTNAIPNPTKDGHTFTGWFRDEGCTEPVGAGVLSDGQYIYSGWSEVIVPEPPVEHTVTFVIHDDIVSTKVVIDGYVVERPTDPVRDGYTFVGWYTTIGYEERYDFGTPVMQDISLYAKWTENIVPEPTEYTVSFNTNGGSDVADMIVLEGSKASKPVDPSKDGHTFVGWFMDSGLTEVYDWDTEVVSDMVLYAKWTENIVPEPEEYTVTFESNGGSDVEDMIVLEGSKASKPVDPTKDGYTFAGWFMDSGLTEVYDWDSTVTDDMTLYAKWHEITIEKHTVRFTANGGSAVEDLIVNKGEKAVKPADPSKDGYRFDGWYTNAALTQAYDWDSVVNEDLVLYAKWLSNIVVDDSDEKDSDDDNMVSQIVQLSMIVGGALLILVGIRTRPAVIILGILLAIGGIVDVSSILEMIGIEGL